MVTGNNNHPSKVWFCFAGVLSLVIVLLNLYYSFHATPHLSQPHDGNCVPPSTQQQQQQQQHLDDHITNINIHDTVPLYATKLVAKIKQKQTPKRTVIVFTCNEKYGRAVASSVISVRIDGGYHGDVAILMEESQNFTIAWMQHEIQQEHETQQRQQQNQNGSRNATFTTEKANYHLDPLHRVFILSTDELWDSLLSWSSSSSPSLSIANLRETPSAGWCTPPKRMSGHRGYFLKTLIYHPIMAERWDTVLFLDACMTIHSPHLDEIFAMPEVERSILALPDPWRWGQNMLWGRLLSCTQQKLLEELAEFLGQDLHDALYFTTGLVLYDTDVIRNYRPSQAAILSSSSSSFSSSSKNTSHYAASLIELLQIYHKYSSLFPGDQPLVSIYWYHVRNQMRNLPLTMLGTNRVPYEFIKRLKSPHIVSVGNAQRPTCLARPKHGYGSSALDEMDMEEDDSRKKKKPKMKNDSDGNVGE